MGDARIKPEKVSLWWSKAGKSGWDRSHSSDGRRWGW